MRPKKSSLVLIIIFSLTVLLGGTAVFIGYRLSQEEEVTPEEPQADESCNCSCESYDGCGSGCEFQLAGSRGSIGQIAMCNNGCTFEWEDLSSSHVCSQCFTDATGCNRISNQDCVNKLGEGWELAEKGFNVSCSGYSGKDCEKIEALGNCSDCGNPVVCNAICVKDQPVSLDCGDTGCTNDNECGAYICRTTSLGETCVGEDYEECDINEHIANDCVCEEQTLTCENLTIDGQKSVTVTAGEAKSGTLEVLSGGSVAGDRDYTFATDTGYGSVDPEQVTDGTTETSSWNITSSETDALSAGTHEDVIYVTVEAGGLSDGGKGDVNCSLDLVVSEEELPSFDAQKNASIVCINNDTAARINYSITVTNTSEITGTILSVEDEYDERINESWVSNILPTPDSHSGNTITWNNNGDGYVMEGGESIEFSYEVVVPEELFGETLRNVVTVTPEDLPPIIREKEVEITCLPDTGLFDNAVNSILVGLLMVVMGVAFIRFQDQFNSLVHYIGNNWSPDAIKEKKLESNNKEFEEKTLEEIDNK